MTEGYFFDVFGRTIAVFQKNGGWVAHLVGQDGKRRRADFEIPSFIQADELAQYLDDLFHESASPMHPCVLQLLSGKDR